MNDRLFMGALVPISLGFHLLIGYGLLIMPRPVEREFVPVSMQLREKPRLPPLEPPRRPEPPKPPPEPRRQPIHERARRPSTVPPDAPRDLPPRESAPTERQATGGVTTTTPVFGITMESTSSAGDGPVVPVGNTLLAEPKRAAPGPAKVAALAPPVQAYEVTKMPLPKGKCTGEYTDDARQAGVEGTVVLDLVVGEDGVVRDITVVKGLDHGLTEAAITAAKRCRFVPGERDGMPVPVRIRGFKITFYLQGGGD